MSIDMMDNSRAPSHKKPPLPPAGELAALLRTGISLDDLAARYDRRGDTLRPILNGAGWSTTGDPLPVDVIELPVLGRLWDVPKWMDEALCAQTGPEAFFPNKGGSTREAKETCRSCPVQVECLDFALESGERFGIWGGVSERDRRKLAGRPQPSDDLDTDQETA